MSNYFVILFTFLSQVSSLAFNADTLDLDVVVLKSVLINQSNPALTVSKISYNENEIRPINFQDAIEFSSSVWITNTENQAQDNRMSIRGFGARSAFGIRGIKIVLDDIPLTTPDGQSQVDNIPFDLIQNIEILKSLSSTRHGNASGGVVYVNTFSELSLAQGVFSKLSFGTHGYKTKEATYSKKRDKSSTILRISQAESNGYRGHSGYKNKSFFFKHTIDLEKVKLKMNSIYFDSPYAFDPGGLTIESVNENRSEARNRNVLFDAKESVKQLQTGLAIDWKTVAGTLKSSLYYSNRDFVGLLPFTDGGYVELSRDFAGLELSLNNRFNEFEWTLGTSMQSQADDRKRFQNNEGVKGETAMDQLESFDSYGVFALGSLNKPKYSLQAGIRFDVHQISMDDNFGLDQQYVDYSSRLSAYSPNIGFIYNLNKNDELYASFGSSYETPSLSELSANPDGSGFNNQLSPMVSNGFDIGYRKSSRRLSYSFTAFHIDTKDEIVRYELEGFESMNFYKNLGLSKRYGIEGEGSYNIGNHHIVRASYTQAKYEFENQGVKGELAGIPKSNVEFEWLYNKNGFNFKLDFKQVSSMFADNNNEVKVPSYALANIAVKNNFNIKGFSLNLGLQIRNLFDVKYYDNIRTNAFGNRFYEPASLRQFIFSVNTAF
jgi:iron complex outermembrane receptor protein